MSIVLGTVRQRHGRRASVQQHKRHSTAHRASPKKLRVFRGTRSLPSPLAGFLSAFRVDSAGNYSGGIRETYLGNGRSAVAATGLEEKYDAVRQLIAVGKERGYLLYDEVNDSLPAEVHSSEEIDDLLTTFERNGIEIYEDKASAKAARAVEVSTVPGERDAKEDAHEADGDLDLTPGSLEKTNDPVRMYL